MTRPCPFCGVSEFPDGLTYGHKEGCFFDLVLRLDIISEQEYGEAFDRRTETLSSAVASMLQDNRLQFTRAAWDELGVVTSVNRIYMEEGELRYCSWDGTRSVYMPTIEDVAATDWRVL